MIILGWTKRLSISFFISWQTTTNSASISSCSMLLFFLASLTRAATSVGKSVEIIGYKSASLELCFLCNLEDTFSIFVDLWDLSRVSLLKVQNMMKSLYLAADVSWKPTSCIIYTILLTFYHLKIPLAKCTWHILNNGMQNCTIRYLKLNIFLLSIVNLLYKSFLDLNFAMSSSTFILLYVAIINDKLIQAFKFIKYNCVYLNILIRFVNRKFICIFSTILSEDSTYQKIQNAYLITISICIFLSKK